MTVTVHEILSLKKFNNFRLIAGANGLDRPVAKGGFIDHESAIVMRDIAFKNEMIFSNLPMIKDHPELIVDYVMALIDAECACFAIKTIFFDYIPEDAIELANQKNFPIFLFEETYIEELILDIDEAVNLQKKQSKVTRLIEAMTKQALSAFEIKKYALEVNRYFHSNVIVSCFKPRSDYNLKLDLKLARQYITKHSIILQLDEYYLLIYTSQKSYESSYEILMKNIGLHADNYHIGFSEAITDLGLLDRALTEGKTALKFSIYKNKGVTFFKDMGIYQLLIPLLDHKEALYYYESIVDKLKKYDLTNHSDLLETAIAYVDGDGDIKKTAKILFQHENTVRYRIRRIKTVLGLDLMTGMAYETLATAIHLYKLNMRRYEISLL